MVHFRRFYWASFQHRSSFEWLRPYRLPWPLVWFCDSIASLISIPNHLHTPSKIKYPKSLRWDELWERWGDDSRIVGKCEVLFIINNQHFRSLFWNLLEFFALFRNFIELFLGIFGWFDSFTIFHIHFGHICTNWIYVPIDFVKHQSCQQQLSSGFLRPLIGFLSNVRLASNRLMAE